MRKRQGAAPGFVNEAAQDYHLQPGSTCLNTGAALHPDALPANEVVRQYVRHQSGEPRQRFGAIDIGAFELAPPRSAVRMKWKMFDRQMASR